MSTTQYFTSSAGPAAGWELVFVLFVTGSMIILGILLFIERPKHDPAVHSPRMAWLRAGLYFGFILLYGWLTGVVGALATRPPATGIQLRDPAWLAFTALCFGLVIWGYVYWWPRGTLTHGRPRHPVASGLFGAAWGTAGGIFFLSTYAVFERFGWPGFTTALATIIVITIYNINYQSGWWDIHVSPPHNIRTWNNRKVLFAHNPFLLASLAYFVIYGNAGIFVLLNACALAASAIAMRFPPFWLPDGGRVSLETAIGE